MIVYLDASVLVALLTTDPLTSRAEAFLRDTLPQLLLSDFAAAEFASVVARRVRIREVTRKDARAVLSSLDMWSARATQRIETLAADIKVAEGYIRRLDLTLRAPDAINIAIAQRADAAIATFDAKLAAAARALGATVVALTG